MITLGIDIGGTKLTIAIFDGDRIVERGRVRQPARRPFHACRRLEQLRSSGAAA